MSTIRDLLDRTVLLPSTQLRTVQDPSRTTSPESYRATHARLRPYHLRHRPHFLEDVCEATNSILGPKLASDRLANRLDVYMDNITRQPVGDELIANTRAFTFWSSAVKDAFEEATDLTLDFERDPTDQGTRTDGRYMVGKRTKLQVELKGVRVSTNLGQQIVTMGKSDDGYGTNLYREDDGIEAGARSIVTKLGKKMSINNAPFGLLFGGTTFIFFQRVVASDRSYLLCSDVYNVVGSRVVKSMVGMCLDDPVLPLPSDHPPLSIQVSSLAPEIPPAATSLSGPQGMGTDAKQGNSVTPFDLDVVFTLSVLNSKLYPVRPVGAPSKVWPEKLLKVGETLGWGGFATVLEARLARVALAVKYYNGSRRMQDRSLTDMDYFQQEVAAYEKLSDLQGEYVPKVYGSYEGVEERFGIILMEVLKGAFEQDLEKVSPELRAKALVALRKVHESGVLHGDIRAQNFYFSSGSVYLLDFSHARVCDPGGHQNDMKYEMEEARVILGLGQPASAHGMARRFWP